jgi:Ca-activated chloride channel family protein
LEILGLGDGTAIGMGLAVAGVHLESSSGGDKVIILLTDGENNAGEISPATAAQVLSELGARIYAIGIGSEEEAELEFTDPQTGQVFRGTFTGGFDEQLLRRIAEGSGGAYFYAGNSGTLEAIFQAIDSIESVERRVRIRVQSRPLNRYFVLFALAGFAFDFLIRRFLLSEVL